MLSCAISLCLYPNNHEGLGRIQHGFDGNGIERFCKHYFHNECIQAYLERHQGKCLCEEAASKDSFRPIHIHPEPGLPAEEGYQAQQKAVELPNGHRTKCLDKFLQKAQREKLSAQNDKIPIIRDMLGKAFDNQRKIRLGAEYEFQRSMDEIYFLGAYGTSLETLNKLTFHLLVGGIISMTGEWKSKENCGDFEAYKKEICIYVMKVIEDYEEYKRTNEINVSRQQLFLENIVIPGAFIAGGAAGVALIGAIVSRGVAVLTPWMWHIQLSGAGVGSGIGFLLNQHYKEIRWDGQELLFAKADFMTRFSAIIRKEKDDGFLKLLYDGENFNAINHRIVRNYFTIEKKLKNIKEANQKAAASGSSPSAK